MTRLRKMMLEELERRNYSPRTIECYIREVEDFANVLSSFSRPLGSPAHPRVPSLFVPRAKAVSEQRYPTAGRSAFLLH